MTIRDLQIGDIIRHAHGTRAFKITAINHEDNSATGVLEQSITNPSEWKLVARNGVMVDPVQLKHAQEPVRIGDYTGSEGDYAE